MLDDLTEIEVGRKSRGAFFTPKEITTFLAKWALRTADDLVLEPSCGDAAFLVAVADRLRALGGDLFLGDRLHGVELHTPSVEAAIRRLSGQGVVPQIHACDFFDFSAPAKYDVVIGNPPFVRYQSFAGEPRKKALEAALRHGVRLSGLTSSWAPFVVHSAGQLKDSGRLGLVLPAELLSVQYASEVRRYLLRRFKTLRIILFEELIFPGVQEEVVLLLAEGQGPANSFEVYQARNLGDLETTQAANWTTYVPDNDGKWTPALLSSNQLRAYQEATFSSEFERLIDWGDTYLGIVTGNNRFFTLSPAEVAENGLRRKDLLQISPPGSRHLRGLSFGDRAWQEMVSANKKCFLFYPAHKEPSESARQYIQGGQRHGVHKAFKCQVREPWWRVPLVRVPDLLLTYMDRERPRLLANRAAVFHLNSLYGVVLHPGRRRLGMDLLPLAFFNSVTLLGAEILGRAYGGGILKLEPKEADELPVPSASLMIATSDSLRALRPQLSKALRMGDLARVTRLVDRVLLVKGSKLDSSMLQHVREARETLLGRRLTRSEGVHVARARSASHSVY